jgi:hypothetical protein
MAHRLQRAARRYEAMDAEAFDEMAHTQHLLLLSVNDMGRRRLVARLQALREVMQREYEEGVGADDSSPDTDTVLIAGLPNLWNEDDSVKQ